MPDKATKATAKDQPSRPPDLAALDAEIAAHQRRAGQLFREAKQARHGGQALKDEAQAVQAAIRPLARTRTAREQARRCDLAAIHAAAKTAGLPEDAYRVHVMIAAGGQQQPDGSVQGARTNSAADLTAAERQTLRARLGIGGRPPRGTGWRPDPKPAAVSEKQWSYIGDLCQQLQLAEQKFSDLVRHIVGIADWHWLDSTGSRNLIAGLLRIRDHKPSTGRRVPSRGNPRRYR